MSVSRERRTGKLIYRSDLTSTLAIFRVELDGGVPEFKAGQFIMLGLPSASGKIIWRAYSIASPPHVRDFVELYIRLAPAPTKGESLTAELWRRKVGDTLFWKPPRGKFAFDDEPMPGRAPDDRRLLLVAGGTGLAPFVSFCLHQSHLRATREIVLCHGARHVAELGYRDVLSDLERRSRDGDRPGRRFRYIPTISRPLEAVNEGWRGHKGRVETLLQPQNREPSVVEQVVEETLDPRTTSIYICGFDGTVSSVLGVVEPMGFRTYENRRPDGSYDVRYESYG